MLYKSILMKKNVKSDENKLVCDKIVKVIKVY